MIAKLKKSTLVIGVCRATRIFLYEKKLVNWPIVALVAGVVSGGQCWGLRRGERHNWRSF